MEAKSALGYGPLRNHFPGHPRGTIPCSPRWSPRPKWLHACSPIFWNFSWGVSKDIKFMKLEFTLMAGAALLATTSTCECAPTFLPLKCGEGTCTPRLVSDTFGTNLSSLPFTGTNTYEFYSPPLLTAASITVNGNAYNASAS